MEIDGDRLKAYRLRLGLTIEKLAEKACLDERNLRRLEDGINGVQQATINKLTEALGPDCTHDLLRPRTVIERFGVDLEPIASKSQIYPGSTNYESNAKFHFTASFLLTPKADGALVAFQCLLFRPDTEPDLPANWPFEFYSRLTQKKERTPAETAQLAELSLARENASRRPVRTYALARRPNRNPEPTDRGNFQIDGEYVDLDSDFLHLRKPWPLKKGVPLNITYTRECQPGLTTEKPVDYLYDGAANISCSIAAKMDDASFDTLSTDAHEWLFWYTTGGKISPGLSPRHRDSAPG